MFLPVAVRTVLAKPRDGAVDELRGGGAEACVVQGILLQMFLHVAVRTVLAITKMER